MERAVFFIALAAAGVWALAALVDGPHIRVGGFADFGQRMEAVREAHAEEIGERAYQADQASIRYAAVRLRVIPEDRPDIALAIANPGSLPTPEISLENGRLLVDGLLRGRVHDCGSNVEVRGYGDFAVEDLPEVTLRTPRAVRLRIDSAGPAEIGAAESVEASVSGCGGAQIGDVAGALKLDLAGAGEVNTGSAATLDLDAAGSSEASVGPVAERAEVSIAGSGAVTIARLTGSLHAEGAGSGEFVIEGGAVTEAEIELAGSGSARIAAPVAHLKVSIVGSGEADIEGEVGEIDAEIAGSGAVRAASVTGAVRQSVMGSGRVEIGQ